MADHIANRIRLIEQLRAELVGPDPAGETVDFGQAAPPLPTGADSWKPVRDSSTGEEVLRWDRPTRRYGVGVLFPLARTGPCEQGVDTVPDKVPTPGDENPVQPEFERDLENAEGREDARRVDARDDFDLGSANLYRPSALGISFLADLPAGTTLVVRVTGGRYLPRDGMSGERRETVWVRKPVRGEVRFEADALAAERQGERHHERADVPGLDGLSLSVEVLARPWTVKHRTARPTRPTLLTVSLVNRTTGGRSDDEQSLFQTRLEASVQVGSTDSPLVLPYPGVAADERDDEEAGIELLYREMQTFAIGHGCAADWNSHPPSRPTCVSAESLPAVEIPNFTPDVQADDGSPLTARMDNLAGLVEGDDGIGSVRTIVNEYRKWITRREAEVSQLDDELHAAAQRNLAACRRAVERMDRGIALLQSDPGVERAFRLANHAMLLQQLRNLDREPRSRTWDQQNRRWVFARPYQPDDPVQVPVGRGQWRAFQIAFLLMCLASAADGQDPERGIVELIWFPTGGGKTEAYLGLAAFMIFLRRLRAIAAGTGSEEAGIEVLMRYTLRLLTTQQFQRAAALLCAMEFLRRRHEGELGTRTFAIGLWVGGTPNSREQARRALSNLERDRPAEHHIVVLERCPWCRAELGTRQQVGRRGARREVHGYERRGIPGGAETVITRCTDPACVFHAGLPVQFIDEDLYDPGIDPVSLLIGTVDKFAMLAWKPEARRLFGREPDGRQAVAPPGLILQDELHLIAGPLGSMVGLYEGAIEELCTDRRSDPVPPKIVTSTATIRGFERQAHALFGRPEALLFPPPGLDAGDSFFARHARTQDGSLLPGRVYLGIHAPALGSSQTAQVRTFSAVLQAPVPFDADGRDPWWTLLLFYNSLRELGGALTLFQSDIPERLKGIRGRKGLGFESLRRLYGLRELTGRLGDDEITRAIGALEVRCSTTQGHPIDVCLASNIIEVGIDIDRLSLMAVVGQPKSTAQYIQVTGRVGRNWRERPGLVLTIYGASKPRDRSHFEKFRSYHERLYAQVEPSSLTPFSQPALDRALHGVIATFVRQAGDEAAAARPYPVPGEQLDMLLQFLEARVARIAPDEVDNFRTVFGRRRRDWEKWQPTEWKAGHNAGADVPLLRWPGSYATPDVTARSWETPTSMRNVDAECNAVITALYNILATNIAGE